MSTQLVAETVVAVAVAAAVAAAEEEAAVVVAVVMSVVVVASRSVVVASRISRSVVVAIVAPCPGTGWAPVPLLHSRYGKSSELRRNCFAETFPRNCFC